MATGSYEERIDGRFDDDPYALAEDRWDDSAPCDGGCDGGHGYSEWLEERLCDELPDWEAGC